MNTLTWGNWKQMACESVVITFCRKLVLKYLHWWYTFVIFSVDTGSKEVGIADTVIELTTYCTRLSRLTMWNEENVTAILLFIAQINQNK